MPISSEHCAGIDALPLHLLGDGEHVRRRDHDDARLEVADQLHLLLGLAAGHRDHRAAEPLGAVVRAETAGEEPVAVRDVHDVAAAGRPPRGSSARRDWPSCRCPSRCSRRRSVCRSSRSTHGCGRSARAAPRTGRTGSSRGNPAWSGTETARDPRAAGGRRGARPPHRTPGGNARRARRRGARTSAAARVATPAAHRCSPARSGRAPALRLPSSVPSARVATES